MKDADVRATLRARLQAAHADDPEALLVDEFGIDQGTVRIDLALITHDLHGFEIKSDRDTLDRLPTQAAYYGTVLDRATLVVGERHYLKARAMIPAWWGIQIALPIRRGLVDLREDRAPALNPGVNPFAIAGLLWRAEALGLLEKLDAAVDLYDKPRAFLHYRLSTLLPLDDLRATVRACLRARVDWREDPDGAGMEHPGSEPSEGAQACSGSRQSQPD
jgi:hypothetical protein